MIPKTISFANNPGTDLYAFCIYSSAWYVFIHHTIAVMTSFSGISLDRVMDKLINSYDLNKVM